MENDHIDLKDSSLVKSHCLLTADKAIRKYKWLRLFFFSIVFLESKVLSFGPHLELRGMQKTWPKLDWPSNANGPWTTRYSYHSGDLDKKLNLYMDSP